MRELGRDERGLIGEEESLERGELRRRSRVRKDVDEAVTER